MKVPSSSLWLPNFILIIFISLTTFCLIVNYLNNTNSHCFNSVPLGLQRLHQLPWTSYLLSINHGRNWYFSQTSLFVPFEVNITIKSKYSASGILDKLTTGQNLNRYSRWNFLSCYLFIFLSERTCILDSFQVNKNRTNMLTGKKNQNTVAGNKSRQSRIFYIVKTHFIGIYGLR